MIKENACSFMYVCTFFQHLKETWSHVEEDCLGRKNALIKGVNTLQRIMREKVHQESEHTGAI